MHADVKGFWKMLEQQYSLQLTIPAPLASYVSACTWEAPLARSFCVDDDLHRTSVLNPACMLACAATSHVQKFTHPVLQNGDTTEASSGPWVCSLRTLYWQSDCSKSCKEGDGCYAALPYDKSCKRLNTLSETPKRTAEQISQKTSQRTSHFLPPSVNA